MYTHLFLNDIHDISYFKITMMHTQKNYKLVLIFYLCFERIDVQSNKGITYEVKPKIFQIVQKQKT